MFFKWEKRFCGVMFGLSMPYKKVNDKKEVIKINIKKT
jgi:hypothetical protein